MTTHNDFLNTKDAAAFMNLSSATLETWRSRGRGPKYYQPGGRRVVYARKDLVDFINENASDLKEDRQRTFASSIPDALRQALFAPSTEEAFKMISATQELLR
jgi:hypothetical protein